LRSAPLGAATAAALGLALWAGGSSGCSAIPDVPREAGGAVLESASDRPVRGGPPGRHMGHPSARRGPAARGGKTGKKIKWSAALGSKASGGPVVASGKVFVGTNNDRPRNPRDTEADPNDPDKRVPLDKGVVMCFDEATGRFLWQAVHDKLPSGR